MAESEGYLKAALQLTGLAGGKAVPKPSVAAHRAAPEKAYKKSDLRVTKCYRMSVSTWSTDAVRSSRWACWPH